MIMHLMSIELGTFMTRDAGWGGSGELSASEQEREGKWKDISASDGHDG